MTSEFETMFSQPYIDIDEWRETPVRHRYVHGGFHETDTRFSFYFPEVSDYQGRFFQHVTPFPVSELLAQSAVGAEDRISMSLESGAYFVETNGGGNVSSNITAYPANAACAQYSKVVASEMYGAHRTYGYLYGGSGGAYRTLGAAENTTDVWDGFVPFVPGTPMAIPSVFSVRMHAQRILRDVFDGIVDAVEPGGSGEPYAGLNEEQAEALREVTRMGFPIRSWFEHQTMGSQAFSVLYPVIVAADTSYFNDFWTVPGYLGADPKSSVHRDRVRFSTTVASIITKETSEKELVAAGRGGVDQAYKTVQAAPAIIGLELTNPLPLDIAGAEATITTEDGRVLKYSVREGHGVQLDFDGQQIGTTVQGLAVGDRIDIDNSNFLAAQTYHRHQVPSADYKVWDQFRDSNGDPIYPQRPFLLGPRISSGASGKVVQGAFRGHMIMIASLLDRESYPWQADWYRNRAKELRGPNSEDSYRLWYVENAVHGDEVVESDPSHVVSYLGVLYQALRELAAWVEQGIEPSPSTNYQVIDGQVIVPDNAAERSGIQPVIEVLANGSDRADISAGESVTFAVTATVPNQAGKIVELEWDFDGDGEFEEANVTEPAFLLATKKDHKFETPGTHFVVVRVTSQQTGNATTHFGRVQNLARVRIVVASN